MPASPRSPLVSVVVPCFNRAGFVTQAIASVFAQTLSDLELLVIDDGSTDGSPEVVAGYLARERAPFAVSQIVREHRGLCRSLNDGLARAGGKYFTVLGSDDLWEPHNLATQIEPLESSSVHVGASFADCWIIDEFGDREARFGTKLPFRGGDIFMDLLGMQFSPPTPTSIFRRDAVVAVGGYNERRRMLEDWDLWIRLSRRYEALYIPEVLGSYRVHAHQASKLQGDEMFEDVRASLSEAISDRPELSPRRSFLEARVQTMYAAHLYNSLRLRDARRAALSALRTSPLERLAWTVLIRSLAGRTLVRRLRHLRTVRRRRLLSTVEATEAEIRYG